MFEVFGPLVRPTPSMLPLWLALLPLLGAASFGRAPWARRRALFALFASALAAGLFLVWSLRRPPEQRMLLANLDVAARVGQLELVLALALDPFGALASAAVSLVAARLVWLQRSKRRIGLLCAMASAMQFVVLADGAATIVLALGVSALVGGALGCVHSTHFVADRVADVSVVCAAGVLFWALGGSWIDGQYVPELDARVVVAASAPSARPVPLDDDDDEVAPPVARGAHASLSFGGMPGAAVLFDGSWLRDVRRRRITSPFFDVPISAGAHSVRFHVGKGSDDFFIPRLDAAPNQNVSIAVRGSTTTFREIQDDLVAREASGAAPGREALARRRFFGGPSAVAVVLGLLAFAFAARVRLFPFAPSSDEPARALTAIGALTLVARVPLSAGAPHAAALLVCVLALASLLAGAIALRSGRAHALLAAELAIACAGAFAGAPALALVHATLATVLFARERPTSAFAHLGLLPTRAAFVGACSGLAMAPLATTLLIASNFVAACALGRRTRVRAPRAFAVLASTVAMAAAFDARAFGVALEPIASRVLAPSFRALPAATAPTVPLFALVCFLVAFAHVASRTRAFERLANAPAFALATACAPIAARATSALARAIAAALVELEARVALAVATADQLLRAIGSLLSMLEQVALVAPTARLRLALPPERALRLALLPVALGAAALFAVPWVT